MDLTKTYNESLVEDERVILRSFTADSIKTMDTEDQKSINSHIPEEEEIHVRVKFTDSISKSKVDEAKATAVAQLTLAFEILDIMKERELKAEPIVYKCLIDACGRVGETERATKLLKMMHDDGIVADGVVYSCLVSAFSVENTYGNTVPESEAIPEWANGASAALNWNKLAKKSWVSRDGSSPATIDASTAMARAVAIRNRVTKFIANRRSRGNESDDPAKKINAAELLGDAGTKEKFVTRAVADQICFGENLLELVYPGKNVNSYEIVVISLIHELYL